MEYSPLLGSSLNGRQQWAPITPDWTVSDFLSDLNHAAIQVINNEYIYIPIFFYVFSSSGDSFGVEYSFFSDLSFQETVENTFTSLNAQDRLPRRELITFVTNQGDGLSAIPAFLTMTSW